MDGFTLEARLVTLVFGAANLVGCFYSVRAGGLYLNFIN